MTNETKQRRWRWGTKSNCNTEGQNKRYVPDPVIKRDPLRTNMTDTFGDNAVTDRCVEDGQSTDHFVLSLELTRPANRAQSLHNPGGPSAHHHGGAIPPSSGRSCRASTPPDCHPMYATACHTETCSTGREEWLQWPTLPHHFTAATTMMRTEGDYLHTFIWWSRSIKRHSMMCSCRALGLMFWWSLEKSPFRDSSETMSPMFTSLLRT